MPPDFNLPGGAAATSVAPHKTSPWRVAFRILRWTTYVTSAITLILMLHKTPPPAVETSPQAAARAEEKFAQVEQSVAMGQAATLRLDESELNSFLMTRLDLAPAGNSGVAPSGTNAAPATPPQRDIPTAPDLATGQPTTPQDVEQMRSSVRDVKIQLMEDRVRAYVLFDMHGKDLTLQLEGRLGSSNGYLRFVPVSGQIGSLPIPLSSLESAMRRLMDSPENREKFRLPPDIADLRIENGEIVATYR